MPTNSLTVFLNLDSSSFNAGLLQIQGDLRSLEKEFSRWAEALEKEFSRWAEALQKNGTRWPKALG